MSYQPPASLMQALQQLEFSEALEPGDPRYVPTADARGRDQAAIVRAKLGLAALREPDGHRIGAAEQLGVALEDLRRTDLAVARQLEQLMRRAGVPMGE